MLCQHRRQRRAVSPLLTCGVLLLLGACKGSPPPAAAKPAAEEKATSDGIVTLPKESLPYLKIEEATPDKEVALLRVPAKVAFRDGAFSQVGVPFPGRVVGLTVSTGARVKKGDPLLTIDSPDAAAARTSLASATAAAREARVAVERETRMLKEGIGIEREKLAAEVRLAGAEADLARARAAAEFAGGGSGGAVVLRSPIDGMVLNLRATVGAAVNPGGEPLVEIGDPSSLWLVAEVFDRDLAIVHVGQRVQANIASMKDPLDGKVAAISGVVSAGMRTASVRITLDNLPLGLRPGMFGRVHIYSDEEMLSLPSRAVLIRRNGDTVLYVSKGNGTFERRTVLVGQSSDGRVRVLSGLNPGEKVLTEGALLIDNASDLLL